MLPQVKAFGCRISQPHDHGFITSCYFRDPNNFNLEITCTARGYTREEFDLELLGRFPREGESTWTEEGAVAAAARPAASSAATTGGPPSKL